MTSALILPLGASTDPDLVGRKAAVLARLAGAGFPVPPGLCVTTAAYRQAVRRHRWTAHPLALPRQARELLRREMASLAAAWSAASPPGVLLWAVRSSATEEDTATASFGGLYRSWLGVCTEDVPHAILSCWASLESEAVRAYAAGRRARRPAMAVLVQPLLAAEAAGVAFSRHPLTHDPARLVINAVLGLGEPFVAGHATADQYVVERAAPGGEAARTIRERAVARKALRRIAAPPGAAPSRPEVAGPAIAVIDEPVAPERQTRPALTDRQVHELAAMLVRVEAALGYPVDVEWAWTDRLCLLQARPLTGRRTDATALWSRTNFMETLPELPSPLAVAFLRRFMDRNILQHYRALGCRVPAGLSPVRVLRGRPYINVTLFESLTAQLGGDPRVVAEQLGGESDGRATAAPLPLANRLRAVLTLQWRILQAGVLARRWFAELARVAAVPQAGDLGALTGRELLRRAEEGNNRLEAGDQTFAIVAGVSQGLQVLGHLLSRRLPDWRSALNQAVQGCGTIISARLILRLHELADLARQEPVALDFFLETPWAAVRYRERLHGTRLLAAYDDLLQEYGHRAIGESDVMSPRFAETPAYLLGVVRAHLLDGGAAARTTAGVIREQAQARAAALGRIRAAFGWRLHEWWAFRACYRLLCHYLALREANRHAQMRYLDTARRLLLLVGQRAQEAGVIAEPEDVFFLAPEEIRAMVALGRGQDEPGWADLVAARRRQREADAASPAPHTLRGLSEEAAPLPPEDPAHLLRGLPISAGTARGPVRQVRSPKDLSGIAPGDILVAPVLDPGMAPVFALAGGIIVEMGGLLSHGAIIAREYGLPAIANVPEATRLLQEGEVVTLDAARGEIYRAAPDGIPPDQRR